MQTDIKRLILAGIFLFSVMTLWQNWELHRNPPSANPVASQGGASGPVAASEPNAGLPERSANLSPSGAPHVDAVPAATSAASYATQPKAVVETDLLRVEVSALGGDIIRAELLKHKATGDSTKNFVLLQDRGVHTYLAQSGLIQQGKALPNHRTVYQLQPGDYRLAEGQDAVSVRLVAPPVDGVSVTKVLTFRRGSYLIDQRFELTNATQAPVAADAYFQIVRDGKAAEHAAGVFGGVTTFTGPAFYSEQGKFQKVKFDDIASNEAKFVKVADNGWVAMIQHYFVSALLPPKGVQRENFARQVNGLYAAGAILPVAIQPGQTGAVSVPLYVGPQEQKNLKAIAPGFDLVVDYGMLTVIAAPLFWLLSFIHKLVGNWGWAIILLTVLIKAAFYPLSAASYRSMGKMKAVMPRLKALQEKHAGDRMKLNQEMMELYKKEKVNPMGGCLPVIVQIPVFIALYWVLIGVVEMRQAPWIGWIRDLSVMDPYFVLPIIMGVTMLIQMKLNPTPPDPIQAKVMMVMPIVFTAMSLFFPAGLVLYWVVNNTLSILQQWYVTRELDAAAAKGK